jgi:hypothetical protein
VLPPGGRRDAFATLLLQIGADSAKLGKHGDPSRQAQEWSAFSGSNLLFRAGCRGLAAFAGCMTFAQGLPQ